MRTSLVVLIAAGALARPATAGASKPSTVTHDPVTWKTVFKVGSDPGDVDIDERGALDLFTVVDRGNPLVANGSCTAGDPVTCPRGEWTIQLSGLDDRLSIWTAAVRATITAGAGDDVISDAALYGTLRAGLGDDTLRANGKQKEVYGDGGDDTLYAWEGIVKLFGGDGNDVLYSRPSWDLPASADGGDGYDIVFAGGAGGTLSGGGDDDILGFFEGIDGWSQTAAGGSGHDTIHGSEQPDTITGGTGNDEIHVFGGRADTVDCGPNWDEVYADADDTVAANCERVMREEGPADPRFDAAMARALALRDAPPVGLDAFLGRAQASADAHS